MVSRRVPKVRTHIARSLVSQRTTLPQMGKKELPRLEKIKERDLVQQTCIGQQEYNPVTNSRHVESDNDGGSSPHEPTVRDPPHGENLNVEPVLQSTGVKDGEKSANQEEATCTSPKIQQGRSI